MATPNDRKVFWIFVKVKPTERHSLYSKWCFGWLTVAILDRTAESAAQFVEALIPEYEMEMVGENMKSLSRESIKSEPKCVREKLPVEAQEAQCRKTGYSLFLAAVRPGMLSDEELRHLEDDFEDDRGF